MAREVPVAVTPTLSSCADDCCAEVATVDLPPSSSTRRDVLTRRVRLLVAATISYNVIEAVVAIAAGTVAGSTALIGFGLDSVIEVSSAAVVAWQFRADDPSAGAGRAAPHRLLVLRPRRLPHRRVDPAP